MIKFLFLLPLALCAIWYLYLKQFGYSLESGKQGFKYILIFSTVIAVFFIFVQWLSHL